MRLTSQRPCRHAPNIGVENGMKLQREAFRRTLVYGEQQDLGQSKTQ